MGGVAIYPVLTTLVTADTASDWYEDKTHIISVAAASLATASIPWAGLDSGSMKLGAGKYELTFQMMVKNTHATLGMELVYAITDDAATAVAYVNGTNTGILLPVNTDDHSVSWAKTIILDFPLDGNVVHFQACLANASETASFIRSSTSEIVVRKLG